MDFIPRQIIRFRLSNNSSLASFLKKKNTKNKKQTMTLLLTFHLLVTFLADFSFGFWVKIFSKMEWALSPANCAVA